MIFDEFRMLVQPALPDGNHWEISVQQCPKNELVGLQGSCELKVTAADLGKLRNANAALDLPALKQLGQRVLDTIMPPQVELGFRLCLTDATQNHRGLRLVVSMLGTARPEGGISPHELPLEAAFNAKLDFVAANIRTPVSRGVTAAPDKDPVKIAPPLRILLVVSEPSDKPPLKGAAEKAAILNALKSLISTRAVQVDLCEPPTLMEFKSRLQAGYHVVHFIGHGDFEVAGADPNPQPHLYFEAPDGTSAAADAQQLSNALLNGNVPLVVLTACSTAAAAPVGAAYPGAAFESLAHGLVERQSGPLGAVGMQFDLETTAAEVFSRELYTKLLTRGCSLDEAVSSARAALLMQFGAAHRSWINPTVYWRCKNGQLFELLDTGANLTDKQRLELQEIQGTLSAYEDMLNALTLQPPEFQAAAGPLRKQWQATIQELLTRRGLVLGDTIRLRGGVAAADGTIECALTIQLRLPATIGDARATIKPEAALFESLGHAAGQHAPAGAVFAQPGHGGSIVVLVQNASGGVQWTPGEYELAKVKFRLKDPQSRPLFYIQLNDATIQRNNVAEQFQRLHAAIFSA